MRRGGTASNTYVSSGAANHERRNEITISPRKIAEIQTYLPSDKSLGGIQLNEIRPECDGVSPDMQTRTTQARASLERFIAGDIYCRCPG